MNGLSQKNIYAYNILNARNTSLDQDYSYLISTLMHVESELEYGILDIKLLAKQLMETINQSRAFRQVDRVCLAITHPGASRIAVLSSFNSNRLQTNIMDIGYSCFVSPRSSLFKTKRTDIRIFSDIDQIISQYEDRPVQRSLQKLKKMGVKSGITVPLNISNVVSGFLFMNSVEEGTFNNLTAEDFTVLCLLKLISLSCLNKRFFGVNGVDSRIGQILSGSHQDVNQFSIDEFQSFLEKVFQQRFEREIKVSMTKNINKEFLFAQNPVVYTIVKCVECLDTPIKELKIELGLTQKAGVDFIELRLKGVQVSITQLAFMQDLGLLTNHDVGMKEGDFFINLPLDEYQGVDYST